MINGVKKLEFIFKTSVAHTETINPIYWVPTIHQKKQNQTIKFQKEAILYHKTLILVCVPPFQKKKKQKISPVYRDIFWVQLFQTKSSF